MNRELQQRSLQGRSRRPKVSSPLFIFASLATIGLAVFVVVKIWPRASSPDAPPSSAASEFSTIDHPSARVALPAEEPAPVVTAVAPEPPSTAAPMPEVAPTRRETICTKDGCVGPEHAKEKTRRLLEEHPGKFAAEEVAILNAYTVDGLGQAVRDAEARFLKATDATRDRDEENYRRVLNLVAAVSRVPPTPMSEQEKQAYERYAAALRRADSRLTTMGPEAAERERMRIKEESFARLQARR